MAQAAKDYRPEGMTTITPYLCVRGGADAIDFYRRAFGAKELSRMASPDGLVGHATLLIGDATVYLSDEMMGATSPKTLGGSPVTLHMYVPDCDATFKQAVAAGATEIQPPADQFWGDRYGQVEDPFGHRWGISTQKEEVSPEEMEKRSKAAMPGG
jgi:PhnB protein